MSEEFKGNEFDSEKAFHDAVEPGRRSFLKKMMSVVGAAAIVKAVPAQPPVQPSVPEGPVLVTQPEPVAPQYFQPVAFTSMSTYLSTDENLFWEQERERRR